MGSRNNSANRVFIFHTPLKPRKSNVHVLFGRLLAQIKTKLKQICLCGKTKTNKFWKFFGSPPHRNVYVCGFYEVKQKPYNNILLTCIHIFYLGNNTNSAVRVRNEDKANIADKYLFVLFLGCNKTAEIKTNMKHSAVTI